MPRLMKIVVKVRPTHAQTDPEAIEEIARFVQDALET